MERTYVNVGSDGQILTGYIDRNGNQITKTPEEYKYSYDEYVVHRAGKNEEIKNAVYSDRLAQWDSELHDKLCQKHFGNSSQYWHNRSPEKIEAFLKEYEGKPTLKIILISKGCNPSSGYPYWVFEYSY